jgi:putative MATE family efflux protein
MANIKEKRVNLLEGSLIRGIIKLGYPIALGSLVQTLYNLADAFWLGKLGRAALAAPIISFFIIFFLIAVGLGFSISGTALVSQYIGAKEKENAVIATGNLLLYLMLISTVLSALGLIFARPLLALLETPADTFDLTYSYYSIVMAGMPLSFPMFVYHSAMNGYGDTMSPLKISLFTAAVNLVLDPVLIFGWLGFPALGVKGAAITTLVTRALASMIGLYLFFSGKKGIRLTLSSLKPHKTITRLMMKIGIPSAVGFSGSSLGFIVLMGIVNQFGTPVISAYGIATRVIHLFMLPAMGISSAVTAVVGQNLGAGQTDRARAAVRSGIHLMLAIIVLPMVMVGIFGKELTRFFIPGDPLVHEIGRVMFYITPPSVIFFGLTSVLEGAFQGAGYTTPVMVSHIARIWVFRIPFVYILSMVILNGPADISASVGIWWGMVLSNGASFLMMATWFKKADWATARIKKEAAPS